ncbi:glycoside hydrolase family 3 N-terminal domain-containing protein [Coxiella-like endosymbiont of Rhipicephalus sanguineus]|uniref:glycoside hydrolase family 3 N-terminal domain-containing protein n=1 Tax=Coxiella-like endosymbiont of Rhipicephalus sanguineus TaxID=1955402 RepID=UPI00203EB0FE|nr:glycoside hydrolase family 3 N-terminal domain-containing protein [Coxiella-like endosymbiont of Rhipicephalus sanguineus]
MREQFKFTRIIISDDLTMEGAAIMGGYSDRAAEALEAGCDLMAIVITAEGLSRF